MDPALYDIRGDLDLDGDIDFFDESLFFSFGFAPSLGAGALSNLASRRGYAGYEHDGGINALAHVRRRALAIDEGRWTSRDPTGYDDGANLYAYVGGNPLTGTDATGLAKGVPTRNNPNLDANIKCLFIDNPDDGTGSGGAATPCTLGFFGCVGRVLWCEALSGACLLGAPAAVVGCAGVCATVPVTGALVTPFACLGCILGAGTGITALCREAWNCWVVARANGCTP